MLVRKPREERYDDWVRGFLLLYPCSFLSCVADAAALYFLEPSVVMRADANEDYLNRRSLNRKMQRRSGRL